MGVQIRPTGSLWVKLQQAGWMDDLPTADAVSTTMRVLACTAADPPGPADHLVRKSAHTAGTSSAHGHRLRRRAPPVCHKLHHPRRRQSNTPADRATAPQRPGSSPHGARIHARPANRHPVVLTPLPRVTALIPSPSRVRVYPSRPHNYWPMSVMMPHRCDAFLDLRSSTKPSSEQSAATFRRVARR